MSEPTAAAQPALTFDAPADTTQATGIVLFEVRFVPAELTTSLVALTADRQQVAEFRTQLNQTGGLTSVISRDGSQIESELHGEVTTTGQVNLRGRIGGQDFQISGSATGSHSSDTLNVNLSDEQRYLLQPWTGLTSSLQSLNLTQRDQCQSCLLVGAIVVQAANVCVDGDPGGCGVLIDAYALFQNHCVPPPCM